MSYSLDSSLKNDRFSLFNKIDFVLQFVLSDIMVQNVPIGVHILTMESTVVTCVTVQRNCVITRLDVQFIAQQVNVYP